MVLQGWSRKTDWLKRDEFFFVKWPETVFGKNLRIVAPVIRYESKEVSSRWLSPPKLYRSDKEVRFRGENNE